MTIIKTTGKGVFAYLCMYSGKYNTTESLIAKRIRFEEEIRQACANDAGFASYVQEHHKGYGQGINCFDSDKYASVDILEEMDVKADAA